MKTQKVRKSQSFEKRYELKSMAISLLGGCLISVLFMFAFALVYVYQDLPLELFHPLGVFILVVGCLAAGFICARLVNQHGMMWGGTCGSILFLCLLAVNLLFICYPLGSLVFTKAIMMITAGMLGGILGVNFGR